MLLAKHAGKISPNILTIEVIDSRHPDLSLEHASGGFLNWLHSGLDGSHNIQVNHTLSFGPNTVCYLRYVIRDDGVVLRTRGCGQDLELHNQLIFVFVTHIPSGFPNETGPLLMFIF